MTGYLQNTQHQGNRTDQHGGSFNYNSQTMQQVLTPQSTVLMLEQERGLIGYPQSTDAPSGQDNVPYQALPTTPPRLVHDSHDFTSRILNALTPFRTFNTAKYQEIGFPFTVDRVFKAARTELHNDLDKYNREYRPLMRELAQHMTAKRPMDFRLADHENLI
jgi:hypothetical protein